MPRFFPGPNDLASIYDCDRCKDTGHCSSGYCICSSGCSAKDEDAYTEQYECYMCNDSGMRRNGGGYCSCRFGQEKLNDDKKEDYLNCADFDDGY